MKQSTRFQTVNTIIAEAKSRIVLMRSHYCLITLLLMLGVGNAWAQTYNSTEKKWYSLYTSTYSSTTAWAATENPSVFAPTTGTFTIGWYENKTSAGCDLWVNDDKIASSAIWENHTSAQNTSTSVGVDISTVKVKFYSSRTGYFGKYRIPLAKHIRLNNGSTYGTTSYTPTIPNTSVESTSSAIPVNFRSFLTDTKGITITLTNGDPEVFRLGTMDSIHGVLRTSASGKSYAVGSNACASANGTSNATAGGSTLGDISKYGFNVYFRPKAATTYSGTITITDGTSTATVTLSGTGVLNDNTITWNVNTSDKKNWGSQVDANATATNNESGCPAITYSVESGKSSYVTIANGKITFNKAGAGKSVKITASQAANHKYNEASLEKTFTIKSAQSLSYRDTTIDVSTSASDKITADISTLMASHTGNGSISYDIISGTNGNLSGSIFYATTADDFKIKVSAARSTTYDTCSTVMTVHVVKRTPTFTWKSFEHIYASDVLEDVAQAQYAANNVSGLEYSYTSANTDVVVVDGTYLRVQPTGFNVATNVEITVNTKENAFYKAGEAKHTYTFEPKATPVFMLNGETDLPEKPIQRLDLLIGETATMAFTNTDESEGRFTYPVAPFQFVRYDHNSDNHTGVITGIEQGNKTIQFHQQGTNTIFEHTRSLQVYVRKHEVTLSTTLNGGTWKVDSVYTGAVYSVNAPTGTQPAQNAVTVTSSNEKVLKIVDGNWKAVGEGEATLTIAQANNDYWTGDTITANITVEKYTPEFTWNLPATVNYNRAFTSPVTSTNTDEGCTFSYVSGNTSVINWTNNALRTFEKTGNNIAIQVTQQGNYKWESKSQTFYVNVEKLADHVPFTMNTSTIKNAVYGGKANKGSISCSDGGTITLDQNGGIFIATANALYYDIHFSGIPNSVSFTYQQSMATSTAIGSTGHSFTVYQKGESGDWSELWTSNGATGDKSEHSVTVNNDKLSPDTRYLRFFFDGTYTGYYKNISVTERTEIKASKETVDFGEADASSDPTNMNIKIDWYNVNPLALTIEGTNESQFTVSPASIASTKDSYAKNVALTVSYKHNRAAVKDTAILVITDGTTTKRIGLKGVTNKVTPEITWKENLTPMQRGVGVKEPAISPVALSYISTDSSVVDVIGDSIVPMKKGEAQIIASFDGTYDAVYNSTSSTLDVVVTDVKVQHINWTQNFKRLKWTDDEELSSKNTPNFALKATVSYYDADKKEEITIERPITFKSNNTAVVQVLNDTILHVVGIGTTTLEAHVDGIADSLFEATAIRDVIVREPSLDCEAWVLDNKSGSIAVINEVSFDLEGEADSIYFDAWREIIKIVFEFTSGDLYLAEVYEDGSEKNIWNNETPLNTPQSYKCPLSRDAKKVRFYTTVGATGYHNFDGVYARRARYVEFEDGSATKSIAFTTEDAKPGVAKTKTFTVNYSNITDQLDFEFKGGADSKFSIVSPKAIGKECGDHGQATVTVQFLSNDVDTYKDTLLIKNFNQTLTVYLSAEVDKRHQQITWNPATTDLKTTDEVTFDATTNGSAAGLSVRYEVTEGDAATVNAETGALTIIKDGSVTIEATAAGNKSYYDADTVRHTFTISKVQPEITALPTAATMTMPNTSLSDCALTGGTATVAGTFAWDDKTINATFGNAGYTVVFTPENDAWYSTTTCTVVVPVKKRVNEITWNFDVTEMYCNATYAFTGELAATASSELAVRYETSDASIAYVDDAKNLKIVNGGNVTITAYQDGDDTYAAATPVAKIITIRRFAPTIVTMPTAASMKIGRTLSDATLTGGRAELDGVPVQGSFVWVDGNTTSMNVAGTFNKQIVFAPSNNNYYDSVYTTMNVEVEKYAPVITENTLSGSVISYGQTLVSSNLSGSLTAMDTVKLPSVAVAGTWAWTNPEKVVEAGNPSYAFVTFTPEDTDWYNTVSAEVPLTVNAVAAASYAATTTIVYGQRLLEAHLTNTTKGIFGEDVVGSVIWAEGVDPTAILGIGKHNVAIRFTSESNNYTDGDGICVVTVEEGVVFAGGTNTSWGEDNNWVGGSKPDADDRVTVKADVEITGNVTIGGLTINEDKTVIVKDGATLTIGNNDSFLRANDAYGNLYVENGGQVILGGGEVIVKNFIIEASLNGLDADQNNKPAKSGQVTGENALTVTGDAYFDLALDASGQCSPGWYDFTVPFPVDALTGVSRFDNTTGVEKTIRNEVNYAIMDFSENRRVESGYGWKKFRGVMQPGQCYTITIDDVDNVYRFKKTATGTFNNQTSEYLAYTDSEVAYRGWNGLGNGTMAHVDLSAEGIEKVQIYNHSTNSYTTADIDEYTYVVGASYFIQAPAANSVLNYSAGTKNSDYLRAPRRVTDSKNSEFRLTLTREDDNVAADRLYVCASDEALDRYEIGRDLTKFGTPTDSKVAQVWANAYGMKLCDVDMPLINEKASCTIGLFAPEASTYTLAIERAPEDATLYLTYNGKIIWNLTASSYQFNLAKGTTDGYGLRLTAKQAPQVATGVENADTDSQDAAMRKVIIDNTMYIITPEGRMYDAIGNIVR